MNFLSFFRLAQLVVIASLATTAASAQQMPKGSAPAKRSAAPSFEDVQSQLCAALRERGPNPGSSLAARALPHDSRLVVFPYHKDALYTVHTVFGRNTHFEFGVGEKVIGSYTPDQTEWEQLISATGRDVFVRPKLRGAAGAMTIITDKARYQLDLIDVSSCPDAQRYQRVSWQVTDSSVFEDREAIARVQLGLAPGAAVPQASLAPPLANAAPMEQAQTSCSAGLTVDLSAINPNYEWDGDESLKPVAVFDDGKRTIVKFRANQDLRPVMLAVALDGTSETVDYVPQCSHFLAARLFTHGLILRLGKREVKVRNKSSSCGWFDTSCKSVKATDIHEGTR